MTAKVIIESPRPNNALLVIVEQIRGDDGQPVGEPRTLATLDDGQTLNVDLGPRRMLTILESPRNPPVVAAPVPPEEPQPVQIPVIGGQVTLDSAPAPAEAPAPAASKRTTKAA